jgi:hypothetical protein
MRNARSSIGLLLMAAALVPQSRAAKGYDKFIDDDFIGLSGDTPIVIDAGPSTVTPSVRTNPRVSRYMPHIGKKQMEKAARLAAKRGLKP